MSFILNIKYDVYKYKWYLRYKSLKLTAQKSQKKRYLTKYVLQTQKKLKKIISPCGGRFEYIYFFFIKKIFKKLCGNNNIIKRRVYFLCSPNYPLTKKSKNSRMGSGKGYFLRWVFLIRRNASIVTTKNVPTITLSRIVKWWNLTIPFKVKML